MEKKLNHVKRNNMPQINKTLSASASNRWFIHETILERMSVLRGLTYGYLLAFKAIYDSLTTPLTQFLFTKFIEADISNCYTLLCKTVTKSSGTVPVSEMEKRWIIELIVLISNYKVSCEIVNNGIYDDFFVADDGMIVLDSDKIIVRFRKFLNE